MGNTHKVKKEIFANTSFEETRIAIVEDGKLAELFWERRSTGNIVGNIYKAKVENVLPGISSAFMNIGLEKNAYIYISDVLGNQKDPIERLLKKDQEVMVQVTKAAISTKGMKVTMDVSLPGRYLVLTPFQEFVGVSKNIENAAERARLSEIIRKVADPVTLGTKGCIVRTEAEGATEEEMEREIKYLLRLWDTIQGRFDTSRPPALLHKDMDMTLQVARDILSEETAIYMLDNRDDFHNVEEFVVKMSPNLKERVKYYDGKTPVFKAFNIEKEIEELRKIKVPLPNGGSLIIQEAESLCAIDVNTGRFTGSKSQEETVTATNLEAAQEVARQLRLRNIGGIIVIDFIDEEGLQPPQGGAGPRERRQPRPRQDPHPAGDQAGPCGNDARAQAGKYVQPAHGGVPRVPRRGPRAVKRKHHNKDPARDTEHHQGPPGREYARFHAPRSLRGAEEKTGFA